MRFQVEVTDDLLRDMACRMCDRFVEAGMEFGIRGQAAGHIACFEHEHALAAASEVSGANYSVVPCTDNNGVVVFQDCFPRLRYCDKNTLVRSDREYSLADRRRTNSAPSANRRVLSGSGIRGSRAAHSRIRHSRPGATPGVRGSAGWRNKEPRQLQRPRAPDRWWSTTSRKGRPGSRCRQPRQYRRR